MKRLLLNPHPLLGRSLPLMAAMSCVRPVPVSVPTAAPAPLQQVVEAHAAGVQASWTAVHTEVVELDSAIATLIAEPSPETLQAARQAWLDARQVYSPTEVFRFQGGPIDGPEGVEGFINAWPIDEAYIDYVDDLPQAGIINDPAHPQLDAELLLSLHEQGGEENIATGWHAIEFLLWGQDHAADANS